MTVSQQAEPLIAVQGLSIAYGRRTVLDRVDLAVRPGEIVTLIGPNGAGKTTLVRAILGLVAPSSGTVARKQGLRIGYMPQKLHIEPTLPLTVRHFLKLWGHFRDEDIPQTLSEVGASATLDRAVQTLSGGEFQRVMLARALLRQPDLLVLDEPVQGVDVHGQIALFELIDQIRRTHGCGVLMVSHDLHLVMARTDTVVCINRHVCCSGQPHDVGQHPEYVRLFGNHAAALAVYQHAHNHAHSPQGDVVPLSADPVADACCGHDHGPARTH